MMKKQFLWICLILCALCTQIGAQTRPADLGINQGAEILFQHPLPAMRVEGRKNGTYNNYEMGIPSLLTTKDFAFGEMIHQLRNTVQDDRRIVLINGRILMCSNNWIRDFVHEMKAFRHWEYDLRSFLDFIIDTQRPDGCYYELIKQMDDYHWKMVNENCRVLYPEDNLSLVRLEIEADIEYLVVEGAVYYYRATGDDAWMKKVLPKLEKGINYITSDPKRWDKDHQLVKRAFTIDTWDFTYRPDAGINRKIEADTPMGIMHGDNSGVYQAMNQLAWINSRFGQEKKAKEWRDRAEKLKKNVFKYLWNGKYFIHQLPLNGAGLDDKEDVRLSLSNTYDINRGLTSLEQSRSIIEEYQKRRKTTKAFAEWFTIDPPYDKPFGKHGPGNYVNGAISPFTAGELAKASFENGYEKYGWDILCRFEQMIKRDGTIYFLYSPDTGTQQGGGPSAWGAAGLLSAIDEGLAGIKDRGIGYDLIDFSPRWPITDYNELRYITGYEKSAKLVDVRYILTEQGMRYHVISPARKIRAHILLPEGKTCARVRVDGKDFPFKISTVAQSNYVDFELSAEGKANMEIFFSKNR
ncbi:MAG: trehalase family glycosidase [Planctomycetia bacterium]|nr:trehalase family glycosidase [Planctomycetia bacterium]